MIWNARTDAADPSINQTVIRFTKPAWEKIGPLYEAVNIWKHQPFITDIITQHRLLNKRFDEATYIVSNISTEKNTQKHRRVLAHEEWMVHHERHMCPVQNVIGAFFNAYTFEWFSKCWA